MTAIPTLTAAEAERFYGRLNREGDCWTWTGELNNQGYGRFIVYRNGGSTRLLAHRLAYALEHGEDPGDRMVRHACDNPPCVRGSHLTLGSQSDNMRDAVERGRANLSGIAAHSARVAAAARERAAAGLRTCARCRSTKALEEFGTDPRNPDGRTCYCRRCVAEVARIKRREQAAS